MGMVHRLCAIAVATGFAQAPVEAADHREAPTINELPAADINDIYLFRNPNDVSRLVIAATYNPLSDREFPGTYAFSPFVVYRFAIDTTGDGVFERNIDVTFGPVTSSGQEFTASLPFGIVIEGDTTRPTVLTNDPAAPAVADGGGIQIFAGPRDDPFFFDFVGFNRFLASAPPAPPDTGFFSGNDAFADFNVSSIVIELPIDLVSDGSSEIGVVAFTAPREAATSFISGNPVQLPDLDRMGNPAVNTTVIPTGLKDAFNAGLPQNDATDFGPIIAGRLETVYGTTPANIATAASIVLPDTLKMNFGQPDGYPNGRRLEDDVVDILLNLFLNKPGSRDPVDLVDGNDVPFSDVFPYLARPHQEPEGSVPLARGN